MAIDPLTRKRWHEKPQRHEFSSQSYNMPSIFCPRLCLPSYFLSCCPSNIHRISKTRTGYQCTVNQKRAREMSGGLKATLCSLEGYLDVTGNDIWGKKTEEKRSFEGRRRRSAIVCRLRRSSFGRNLFARCSSSIGRTQRDVIRVDPNRRRGWGSLDSSLEFPRSIKARTASDVQPIENALAAWSRMSAGFRNFCR